MVEVIHRCSSSCFRDRWRRLLQIDENCWTESYGASGVLQGLGTVGLLPIVEVKRCDSAATRFELSVRSSPEFESVKTAHSVRRNRLGVLGMFGSLVRKHGDGLCWRPGGNLEKNAMLTRSFQTVVLGGVVTAVLVVCSLAILTSNVKLEARESEFSVSIREKHRIRSAGFERPLPVYNCRASAKACALAAVQQMCGNDRNEITFADIYVGADGQLEGEWGYRCLSSRPDLL